MTRILIRKKLLNKIALTFFFYTFVADFKYEQPSQCFVLQSFRRASRGRYAAITTTVLHDTPPLLHARYVEMLPLQCLPKPLRQLLLREQQRVPVPGATDACNPQPADDRSRSFPIFFKFTIRRQPLAWKALFFGLVDRR